MADTFDPEAVVRAALAWIGTPYLHQASLKGVGADCLGLVRGVWRELLGPEPAPLPPYATTWAEDGAGELLFDTARRHLVGAPEGAVAAGDVLLFRVRQCGPAKHAGIATAAGRMAHAYEGHAVAETPIPDVWLRRIAGRFRFPAEPVRSWPPQAEPGPSSD